MTTSVLAPASLADAVAAARAAYTAANPLSAARHAEATTVMPGGNTRTVLFYPPFPLAMTRAEGCRLWDADGHAYVDFLGEYTAGIYGHSHPVIRAAIDGALDRGVTYGASNMAEARFARAVCERFGLERVRFTNSGTEANVLAVSVARAFTGRSRVLAFTGGYHGAVVGYVNGASAINVPFDVVLGRYNDVEGTRALLAEHGAQLAAVLVEPMQGSAGCIPGDPAFLAMLREESARAGALLVFDEVMTSRLAPGGLQAALGVRPDLTTLGKYVGGGMSFGAFGGRAEVMDLFDPRRPGALPHAGTFNNNVLTMHAGLAGLTQVYTPDAADALNARGEALRARLDDACARAGAPLQFTGRGSMLAVHGFRGSLRSVADVARGNPLRTELFFFDMLSRGIWLARRGMMTLSLPIGDAECDALVSAVEQFLDERRGVLA
jgi:glutamate-1-semialdehyde 2,1-aminomutase